MSDKNNEETFTEKQLLETIEHLRDQLHRSVNNDPTAFSKPSVLKLSQLMDELIACYTKKRYPDTTP